MPPHAGRFAFDIAIACIIVTLLLRQNPCMCPNVGVKSSINWTLAGCLPVNGQIEILLVRADRNFAEQIEIGCKAAIEITAATAVEFQIGSRRLRNSNSAAA